MSNTNNNIWTQTSNTLYNSIMEAGSKDRPPMLAPGNYVQWKSRIKRYIDTKPNHELIHHCLKNPPYKFMWADKEVPISEGIYNDIYSIVDACPNACEMWKAIKRLKHGESINVQDLETNLYWEFIKFTSQDDESLESYYSRFYKMMNELIRNQCDVTNHQVNVQFLLQLQPEWQRAEKIARVANLLALVARQQPVYNPQTHPTHYTQNSLTRSQQAATRNREKAIVNSPQPIYDQEPSMVAEDDETLKDKKIDELMALISLSFKKIYKPTNNNLRTSSNTSRTNQDNSPRINRSTRYENQRIGNVAGAREIVGLTVVQKSRIQCYNCKEFGHVARECQKPKRAKDDAYHKEKMLLCKQEEAKIQLNAEQADWRDDTDDESEDQELEAHYMYMAQLQEVSPDATDFGPIFDTKPVQKVSTDDRYNVFAIKSKHPEQSESVDDTYLIEQEELNVIIDSLDISYDREQIDQNDDDVDLVYERQLLTSLIEKLKCETDESKNRNKFLETSNKVEIDCAKAIGDLISYKIESQKSFNKYTQTINNLNHTISKRKEKLCAHQETISILSQQKEAQIKLYKARKDKELDKVIALENKVKVLDNSVERVLKNLSSSRKLKELILVVIPTTSVSRTQLKSNPIGDRVMRNNSQGKKQDVEDHRRNVKFSKNKTSVTACNDSLKAKTLNVNFVCATCGKCVLNEKHDICVPKSVNGVNSRTKMPIVVPVSTRVPKCTVKQSVAKPIRKTVDSESNQKPRNITRKLYEHVVEIFLFIVDSGCLKHMTGNLKLLINFVEKFMGTVKFGNDQIAPILGYGDLVQGAVTIKRVYYVEGLNHNLFSIGQFCDADLDVDFRKSTCYIRDLKGNDLLTATSSQAWLWHRRLSHLNFDTINLLSKNDIVVGLPKLKFIKDHLCSSCELGKAKSKDETPEVLIDFLRLVQRGLQAQVRIVRTDKGTKILNQALHAYIAAEEILHQTSVAQTPEQNGVVERRNRTLVEAA
nr:hypothetical protein [Tanacetum cinerariifolium]